eukprot:6468405-Amphidinium_carterae.3
MVKQPLASQEVTLARHLRWTAIKRLRLPCTAVLPQHAQMSGPPAIGCEMLIGRTPTAWYQEPSRSCVLSGLGPPS